ncbi:hypothetical protein [Endozoicomonas sp. SCSIO W0465]|uniref:hypothetical protein n=1 Tax=Endozoicomonas sp. SCSIO W0465 TaxID=2918516 RepID=UPI0020757CBD|nr:hypothetical protein [Endozoicomonas sp. SCSIO W0465]USE34007.1 hypothetical protein MJO57_17740 [Endozoicomonas sp. SCSIO W0465]
MTTNTVSQPTTGTMEQTPSNFQPLSGHPIVSRNISLPIAHSAKIEKCRELVLLGIDQHLPASVAKGKLTHYQGTTWARDDRMMSVDQVLTHRNGLKEVGDVLLAFMDHQVDKLEPNSNQSFPGYQHNKYGALPIVLVNNDSDFIRARVIERGYREKVERFFNKYPHFLPGGQLPDLFTLDDESAHTYVQTTPPENLKAQITWVYQLIENLKKTTPADPPIKFPEPSFLLRNYITDNLARLTPGTTDPEINILSLCGKYLKALATDTSEAHASGHQLTPMVVRALIYVYTNVIDNQGLPVGADYLDIFNDILANSCLLTNAAILLDGLKSLHSISSHLDSAVFSQELNKAAQYLPDSLKLLKDSDAETVLASLSQQLQNNLRTHLLFDANQQFNPRWFVRSEHKVANPVQPGPIIKEMIAEREALPDAQKFKDGSITDPFGLAWAVIAGAVPRENYPDVAILFQQFYNNDGQLFIPMGNSGENKRYMVENKGFTFWPDKLLRCGIALMIMYNATNNPEYLELARKIHDKVSKLENFNEYYLMDKKTGSFVPSGSQNQGWHIFTYYQLSHMLLETDSVEKMIE